MGFSSGTYTYTTSGTPYVTGTVISSTVANAVLTDTASALSQAVLKDGTQTLTADIPFGAFKITGLGAGSALTDSANLQQVQYGFGSFLTSVAGTNTITGTATPTPAYAVGQRFTFVPAVTNTGATTLNISSVGAGAVQWKGSALIGGELVANLPVTVYVTATTPVFEIVSAGGSFTIAPTDSVAAHATTSNIWGAREIVLTGSAVTFTDIADAPYVGAVAWVKQNAAHIWTDGAVFDVQGGSNYTAAAGDWIRVYATTVSTFEVTIFVALNTLEGAATQTEQETAGNITKAVTPGRQQFHPSAVKAWVRVDTAGSVSRAYNVASVTDTATGKIAPQWTTDFSGATDYATNVDVQADTPLIATINNGTPPAVGACTYNCFDTASNLTDPNFWYVAAFGDQ